MVGGKNEEIFLLKNLAGKSFQKIVKPTLVLANTEVLQLDTVELSSLGKHDLSSQGFIIIEECGD
eukprot:maker-scaffold_15-snap-gene-5.60-mRNA-1 protein AED:0.00 eAED:0.00 QI:488/1/1/1/1/1/2/177/64